MPLARFMKIWDMATTGHSLLSLIFVEIRHSVQRNPAAISKKPVEMEPKSGL